MGVQITARRAYAGVSATIVKTRADRMLVALRASEATLSILITGDAEIERLNAHYRGKPKPTDVLAFALSEGEHAAYRHGLLGDVVLSVPTCRRQARERNVALMDELTMLLAHGILHLFGWDHDTPAKDRAMRTETERLCRIAASRAPSRVTKRGVSQVVARKKRRR